MDNVAYNPSRFTRVKLHSHFQIHNKNGSMTWAWPLVPPSMQKFCEIDTTYSALKCFKVGAYMPMILFAGLKSLLRISLQPLRCQQ